jgi:hypothetical protein
MKKVLVAAVAVLTLASCGTVQPDLYSWYDSEDATYQYTKRASEEKLAEAMAQYKKVISTQKGARGVVPPGVNAEYGYLLVKAGQKQEGLTLLKQEVALYPESEKFISRIIKQLEK